MLAVFDAIGRFSGVHGVELSHIRLKLPGTVWNRLELNSPSRRSVSVDEFTGWSRVFVPRCRPPGASRHHARPQCHTRTEARGESSEHRAGSRHADLDGLDEKNGDKAGERRRAVVIGAGLGGLSTAIHLARQGWKVDVIERNARSGGRMNVIQEKGFTIDMGPTMLMMPEVIENTFKACGRDVRDYLSMQRLTPAYTLVWPDGTKAQYGWLHSRNDRARPAVRAR